MKLTIIDYDAGNLRNVQKAIEHLGFNISISNKPEEITKADVIILPGVGSFSDGMNSLLSLKLIDTIKESVLVEKKPILGICLGMQLLARSGSEGGDCSGLDLLPMEVKKFNLDKRELRIPHMGWNDISIKKKSGLFNDIPDEADFYFVHSYFCSAFQPSIVSATCNYGQEFVVAVEMDNVFGVQFHPEKSQQYGLKLLQNFINICLNKHCR